MDPIEVKLNVLIDGMDKKEEALNEIADITENQSTVLESGLSRDEIMTFIVQMNREKQTQIQTVLCCDSLFEQILKEIGPELDARTESYKPQIAALQTRIKRVMDLDVGIRVCEERNNDKLRRIDGAAAPIAAKQTPLIQQEKPPVSRQAAVVQDGNRVIKAYENNSKNFKG